MCFFRRVELKVISYLQYYCYNAVLEYTMHLIHLPVTKSGEQSSFLELSLILFHLNCQVWQTPLVFTQSLSFPPCLTKPTVWSQRTLLSMSISSETSQLEATTYPSSGQWDVSRSHWSRLLGQLFKKWQL